MISARSVQVIDYRALTPRTYLNKQPLILRICEEMLRSPSWL